MATKQQHDAMEPWTREAILAWVDGDAVGLLDAKTCLLPLPDWLHDLPTRDGSRRRTSAGQMLASAHPEDRQALVDRWWDLVRRPGEPFEMEIVVRGEGGWVQERVRHLNLCDHPDVGGIIAAVRLIGDVEGVALPATMQYGDVETVDLLIHELDQSGLIIRTEGRVAEITGRSADEVIGQSVLEHLHPDGFQDALDIWMDVMAGPVGTSRTARQKVLRPDGSTVWIEVTVIKRVAEDGTPTATVICHDLTERRKQEAALRTSQREFRLLAEQVPAAVFQADADQRLTFRNERWSELLEDGLPVQYLHGIVHREDRGRYDQELLRLVSGPTERTVHFEVRGCGGTRVLAISCQSVIDVVNETRSFVGAVTDITATVLLRERAERDPLTGLRNRTAAEEHLQRVLEDEEHHTVAVAFVDLDDFKVVNDTHGHEVGDRVLVQIAHRLRASVRPEDLVARYGGDEFVLVVRHYSADTSSILERIDGVLREPVIWEGGTWQPAASIGIARPERGDDLATVLRNADGAMFETKRKRKLRAV